MEGIDKKNIENIVRSFLPQSKNFEVIPMTQGLINDSYKISFTDQAYFLQRLNTQVFKHPTGLMHNIVQWQKSLVYASYHCPIFLKTLTGNYLVKTEQGHFWRMQNYVSKAIAYDLAPNASIAFEAGKLLNDFHSCSKKTDASMFQTHIPQFQDISLRWEQFQLAFKKADATTITSAKYALEKLYSLQEFVFNTPLKLPERICHNDTKLNNMLFHKDSGKALCMIDLDTLMPGYAFYDFGDALRTIANTWAEGAVEKPVAFRKDHALAFIKGLCSNPTVFSRSEWESLPFGAVYMPFIHGLRALTDYLSGNVYYKVRYELENLDRASGLLDFATVANSQQAFLKHTIQEAL